MIKSYNAGHQRGEKSVFKRIWTITRSCRRHLLGILGMSLVAVPLTLLAPLPLKLAVDTLAGKPSVPHWIASLLPHASPAAVGLTSAVGLLLFLGLLANGQGLLAWRLNTITGEKLVWDLRATLL